MHGILPTNVAIHGDTIDAGQGPVRVTAEQDPAKLPWKELDVDVALECTGFFREQERPQPTWKRAPKVLISRLQKMQISQWCTTKR